MGTSSITLRYSVLVSSDAGAGDGVLSLFSGANEAVKVVICVRFKFQSVIEV